MNGQGVSRRSLQLPSILLRGLCDGIVSPPQTKGRPRLDLGDVVYGATMKETSMDHGMMITFYRLTPSG